MRIIGIPADDRKDIGQITRVMVRPGPSAVIIPHADLELLDWSRVINLIASRKAAGAVTKQRVPGQPVPATIVLLVNIVDPRITRIRRRASAALGNSVTRPIHLRV